MCSSDLSAHLIVESLQDACDLTALGSIFVAIGALKEGCDVLTIALEHVLAGLDELPQLLSSVCLKECSGHTFLQRRNRTLNGTNVSLGFCLEGCEGSCFFLT